MCLPGALAKALTSRVGLLLATGRPAAARLAAVVGMAQGIGMVSIAAGSVYALGDSAGYIFTADDNSVQAMRRAQSPSKLAN